MRTLDRARIARVCAPLVFLAWIACSDEGGSGSSELPDSVSAVVGVKGGVLKAKGLTLEIPEGALDKTVRLSIENKGKSAPASLKTKQLSDTYEFGPEGTKFKKQVGITFQVKEVDPKAVVYFTKEGSREFEQIESEVGDGKVVAKVAHFSQGFVGVPLETDPGMIDPDSGADEFDAGTSDAGTDGMDAGADAEAPSEDAAAPMPDPARITVQTLDEYGVPVTPTFAAYQDGDGAWQFLVPGKGGRYEFDVVDRRYGVAFVCAVEGRVTYASGSVYYEPRSETSLKVKLSWEGCNPERTKYSRGGTVAVPSSETHIWYGTEYHSSVAVIGSAAAVYSLDMAFPEGLKTDLVLGLATGYSTGLSKVQIFRDVTLTANESNVSLDFAKSGYPVGSALATVHDATPYTEVSVVYATGGSRVGMGLAQGNAVGNNIRVLSFATVPDTIREDSDRYVLHAYDWPDDEHKRLATLTTYATQDLSLTMPAPFEAELSAVDTPYPRWSATFQDVTEATSYATGAKYADNMYHYEVVADARWFESETTHTLTFPDLSGVSGFNLAWMPPSEADPYEMSAESRVEAGEVETISRQYAPRQQK